MAGLVFAERRWSGHYQGLEAIFEYTNFDGTLTRTNCGQAAAATLLTHYGKFPADPSRAYHILAELERSYPPDILCGYFGTSRNQVKRICNFYHIPLTEIAGPEAFQEQIAQGNPVLVMLGVSAGKIFNRFEIPSGHWMVAYGFDSENVYLSNWGEMSWDKFNKNWDSFIPRLIGMRLKGLAAYPCSHAVMLGK